jgi:hypothetical protein
MISRNVVMLRPLGRFNENTGEALENGEPFVVQR